MSDPTLQCTIDILTGAAVMLCYAEEAVCLSKLKGLRSVCEGCILQRAEAVQVTDALARGTDLIFRVDIQGAQTVRRVFPDAVTLFLVRSLVLLIEHHSSETRRRINSQ